MDGIDGPDYPSTYRVDHWVELLINSRISPTDGAEQIARCGLPELSVSGINTT